MGLCFLKIFPIFDLTSNYGYLGISESEIITFFLIPLILLIPLAFSPLHRLIVVVMTSFLAQRFLLFFVFTSCLLKLVNFL